MRLAYCANVTSVTRIDDLLAALGGLWAEVRRRSATPGTLGLGLWFPDEVARSLAGDADAMRAVRDALAANDLELVTVNAFPARAFHAPVVKEAVYRPAWTEPARFAYTSSVARAVAGIAPPGSDITLSTLPLGFPKLSVEERLRCVGLLLASVREFHRLRELTGTTIRLALEPEPGCAIETVDEAIELFGAAIGPFAGSLRAGGLGESEALDAIRRHLGVCLDLCHVAVANEDPVAALGRLTAAGVPVFKVQVSSAIEVPDPEDAGARAALAQFAEPRWLHQVGAPGGRGAIDLPQALDDAALAARKPWRVHFHVPLHEARIGGLPTTQPLVERFLRHAATLADPPVLELETYTWSVVPGAPPDLAANVAAEIAWVRGVLAAAR